MRAVSIVPALGFFLAMCAALAGARAAESAATGAPTPVPTASPAPAAVGSTPVAGCPRFFTGFDARRVDACARALAGSGWGLTAIAWDDAYAGFFSAASPLRTIEESPADTPYDPVYDLKNQSDLVGFFGRGPLFVFVREAGRKNLPCGLLLVHSQTMGPKPYGTFVSEQAARGCVPGGAVTFNPGIEDETEMTEQLFLRGDPKAVASLPDGPEVDFAPFEKRARARGFQRLALGHSPDRFGRIAGRVTSERIPLGRSERRYDAVAARLALADRRGERAIDLFVDREDAYVDVLWLAKPR